MIPRHWLMKALKVFVSDDILCSAAGLSVYKLALAVRLTSQEVSGCFLRAYCDLS